MKKEIEKLSFQSKEEYLKALSEMLEKLNKSGEYVVFVHQYGPHPRYKGEDPKRIEATRKTGESILKIGLDIDFYNTITGTACLLGDAKKVSAEQLFNYKYSLCGVGAMRGSCIIAIPKYVNVEGRKVEYAYCNYLDRTKEMVEKADITARRDHFCMSLFDVIKGNWFVYNEKGEKTSYCNPSLPKVYMLAMQEIIEEEKEYSLILPHTHLSECSQQEKQKHYDEIRFHVENAQRKFGTKDIPKLVAEKIIYDAAMIEEREWQDESGW